MSTRSFFISATHKSSGKTTIALALAAAFAEEGKAVQTFKKGPDYIDPMWLGRASGVPCRNLDFHTQTPDGIRDYFLHIAGGSDLAIVEGNKGLFDGVDVSGSDSNAALASLLELPVVLVVDTRGITRGIAPLIHGYRTFAPSVTIAGVILNQVGGPRHEKKMRAAIAQYTDVPVLGAIGRYPEMQITERHLGLTPTNEAGAVDTIIAASAAIVRDNVDLAAVLDVGRDLPAKTAGRRSPVGAGMKDLRIGVARDEAFGFYYADDLECLERGGAELCFFDTQQDARLPDVDGLFIGGGFPETHAAELAANKPLLAEIAAALRGGLPAYAECGGLMYLSRNLTWQGHRHEMVGFLPGDTMMHDKPVGRGYVRLARTANALWPAAGETGAVLPAHEFHYASLENLPPGQTFAFDVVRGYGIDGEHDGLIVGNLLACFSHQRCVPGRRWTEPFVQFIRACKNRRGSPGDPYQAHNSP